MGSRRFLGKVRRGIKVEQALPEVMDPELIRPFEDAPEIIDDGFMIKAVLFGTGEMRRLQKASEVWGLVLAGYEGLRFGDDGTYTALVASELSLSRDGWQRVESIVDEAVRSVDPNFCAEFVGHIATDEAALHLDIYTKREMGVPFPVDSHWSNGSLHIA